MEDEIILEQLYLGHNNISGPGFGKIGEALKYNRSLKKLCL
jgi:hypothetical protein